MLRAQGHEISLACMHAEGQTIVSNACSRGAGSDFTTEMAPGYTY